MRFVSCAILTVTTAVLLTAVAQACPFCNAVALTFSEEIAGNDVAVIAKMIKAPPKDSAKGSSPGGGSATFATGKATFEVVQVLAGAEVLGETKKFEALYFGDNPVGSTFLMLGVKPGIDWATPILVSERARKYLNQAIELPKEGPDRLAFFQDYLEDEDDTLARDAYDEFAKTPFAGVKDLKDRMKHDKIVEWIRNPKVTASRRRLYLTMLGVCGDKKDAQMLEEMLKVNDGKPKPALDAMVAAYLRLKGPDAMDLIDDLYLKNKDAEYTDTYSTIMALRFHGQEEKTIPRERLLVGFRYMLDRPKLADMVVGDLARWEDWTVMDRLVDLFKKPDEDSTFIRVPVINYLRVCPLPKAKEYLAELAKIDPKAMKQAETFFQLKPQQPAPAADKSAAKTIEN